jgi:YHS domain-containing protein
VKTKTIIFFIVAFAISFLAATYKWGDSAHSIGLITQAGGKARHPAYLESGEDGYMLIATATVIGSYRGNARVILEGEPSMDHQIYFSAPVVDLGLRRSPEFKNNILYHLEPKDRVALWVSMKPPRIDPVCGMAYAEGFTKHFYEGREYVFCSEGCANAFKNNPVKYAGNSGVRGRYSLAFYDTSTNRLVLNVPIIFQGKEGAKHAGSHDH